MTEFDEQDETVVEAEHAPDYIGRLPVSQEALMQNDDPAPHQPLLPALSTTPSPTRP